MSVRTGRAMLCLGAVLGAAVLAAGSEALPAAAPSGSLRLSEPVPSPHGPYYESCRRGGRTAGVMLTIHGGNWRLAGDPGFLGSAAPLMRRMCDLGFVVYNVDYSPGGKGLEDLVAFYDMFRARHPTATIFASGESAGGHLAMMLARRRALRGVLAFAAPADLEASTGGVRRAAEHYFGRERLRAWSPARVGTAGTPTLAVYARNDVVVPPSQARLLGRRRAVQVSILPGAAAGARSHPFVHSRVAAASWRRHLDRERRFLRRLRRSDRSLLVVGDSLGVDSIPFIRRALPGWRLSQDVWFARRVADGPGLLRKHGRRLPRVIHVSLGTADDPSRPASLRRSLGRLMKVAGARRCVVWTNVWRPVPSGAGFDAFNAMLAAEAAARPNLRVVDWAAMVARNRHWLKRDAVHADAEGNRARAAAVAAEVRHCRAWLASSR